MTAWQARVHDEKMELDMKISKLQEFFHTDTYCDLPKHEQALLTRQHITMKEYANILRERIKHFNT